MLLRNIFKVHTHIHRIYHIDSIEEKIQLFKEVDLTQNLLQPY